MDGSTASPSRFTRARSKRDRDREELSLVVHREGRGNLRSMCTMLDSGDLRAARAGDVDAVDAPRDPSETPGFSLEDDAMEVPAG